MTTVRGTTKYEYDHDRLKRKILPDGTTADYYYDRNGRFTEARYSTGLVRSAVYDNRSGRLMKLISSDGYALHFSGSSIAKGKIIIEEPNSSRRDVTRQFQEQISRRALGLTGIPTTHLIDSGGGSSCGTGYEDDWDELFGSCDGGLGWGGGFDSGEGQWGPGADPRMTYERCMANICDPADKKFRQFCNEQPTIKQRAECHSAATKEYWDCEASCR